MKIRSLVLAATAACALTAPAVATESPAKPDPTPVQLAAPPAGKGLVVFYRKPLLSLIPFNWIAREGKTEICEMVAATYCVAVVDPGRHTYEVHSEATNRLTLEVDAVEIYYVIGGISMGMIVNHPNITPTPKAQFDAISARLKIKEPFPAAAAIPVADKPALAAPAAPTVPAPPEPVPAPAANPAS